MADGTRMKEMQADIKRLTDQLNIHQGQLTEIPRISQHLVAQQEQLNAMTQMLASIQVQLTQQCESSISST